MEKMTSPKVRHVCIPAAYVLLVRDHQVLLLRRYNTGYADGQYSLVAGHVDAGESFTQCIIREAQEEANIVLTEKDLRVVHVMYRHFEESQPDRMDVFFMATQWEGTPTNHEPHKCDDLSWFYFDSLPNNILPYIEKTIHNFRRNNFFSEMGW